MKLVEKLKTAYATPDGNRIPLQNVTCDMVLGENKQRKPVEDYQKAVGIWKHSV